MNGKRATALRRYVEKHVPAKHAHRAYRSIKRWWSALCADHRMQAGKRMAAGTLPVGVNMALGTPGAPPPKRKRGRS